ncbi:unnamed protein product [Hydatigera taeniaeformis]|uniref:Secreted protein n=1 Tax=Hydatigena taeniaeformis TaxID=6205 RepID=A0A0R3X887_HYDTA|nr:unnamed protein product [Hydatigera taeniaeformis]
MWLFILLFYLFPLRAELQEDLLFRSGDYAIYCTRLDKFGNCSALRIDSSKNDFKEPSASRNSTKFALGTFSRPRLSSRMVRRDAEMFEVSVREETEDVRKLKTAHDEVEFF